MKGWRVRYFILLDNTLYYRKTKDQNSKRIEIKLSQSNIIDEKRKRQFLLEFTDNDCINKLYLKTQTDEEKIKWLEKLTEAKSIIDNITSIIPKNLKIINEEHNGDINNKNIVNPRRSIYCPKHFREDDPFYEKHNELIANIKQFHTFYLNLHIELENFYYSMNNDPNNLNAIYSDLVNQKIEFKVRIIIKLLIFRIILIIQ